MKKHDILPVFSFPFSFSHTVPSGKIPETFFSKKKKKKLDHRVYFPRDLVLLRDIARPGLWSRYGFLKVGYGLPWISFSRWAGICIGEQRRSLGRFLFGTVGVVKPMISDVSIWFPVEGFMVVRLSYISRSGSLV